MPESCKDENPVTLLPSVEKPPVFWPSTSATGLARPYGRLAPAKTLPPAVEPIRGLTRWISCFVALVRGVLEMRRNRLRIVVFALVAGMLVMFCPRVRMNGAGKSAPSSI